MARPGFRHHPKFKRLVFLLQEPVPHVWGYCECLWDVAYQNGEATIGDAIDVELAAEYPGERGKLVNALLDCRLIDQLQDGRYQIHDLLENAPEYVQSRWNKEQERKKEKICERCGSIYHSGETHSKFCSPACRVAHFRQGTVTDGNGGLRNCNAPVTDGNARLRTSQHSTAQHSTAQGDISPDKPASKKRSSTKERKPRKADPLFDAVVEVTGYDPKTNGPHIGKVVAALRLGEPAYTPEEVRALPAVLAESGWDFQKYPMTPGVVEKHISRTRRKPTPTNDKGNPHERHAHMGRTGRVESPAGKYDGIGTTIELSDPASFIPAGPVVDEQGPQNRGD
jgi:hypothetical protein